MYGYFCPDAVGNSFHWNINNIVNPEGHAVNSKISSP
jgi:hypothetical protein